MKTTPLPSVEEAIKPFNDRYEDVGSRLSNEDYWDVLKVARVTVTQRDNQAYTSLVEGIEGLKQDEVCDPTEDCPYCGRNMWCRGHQEEIACNQILTDILENVVNPLYGKATIKELEV